MLSVITLITMKSTLAFIGISALITCPVAGEELPIHRACQHLDNSIPDDLLFNWSNPSVRWVDRSERGMMVVDNVQTIAALDKAVCMVGDSLGVNAMHLRIELKDADDSNVQYRLISSDDNVEVSFTVAGDGIRGILNVHDLLNRRGSWRISGPAGIQSGYLCKGIGQSRRGILNWIDSTFSDMSGTLIIQTESYSPLLGLYSVYALHKGVVIDWKEWCTEGSYQNIIYNENGEPNLRLSSHPSDDGRWHSEAEVTPEGLDGMQWNWRADGTLISITPWKNNIMHGIGLHRMDDGKWAIRYYVEGQLINTVSHEGLRGRPSK